VRRTLPETNPKHQPIPTTNRESAIGTLLEAGLSAVPAAPAISRANPKVIDGTAPRRATISPTKGTRANMPTK
jgi:hypothetical protein